MRVLLSAFRLQAELAIDTKDSICVVFFGVSLHAGLDMLRIRHVCLHAVVKVVRFQEPELLPNRDCLEYQREPDAGVLVEDLLLGGKVEGLLNGRRGGIFLGILPAEANTLAEGRGVFFIHCGQL